MKLPEPRVVWEIGSRDGREAQRLSDAFNGSQIIAFEPNPETYPLVEAVASKNSRIIPKNWAVSSANGLIDFHKINTKETITTWVDGNPGASSLLRSSGKYPHEKYVQDLIQVRSIRASDYLKENPDLQPQLLWIDVQGSEDQVLEGFGSHLDEVNIIIVELSLKEIYENQPLASDVIKSISDKFYFAGVLNFGEWQFDAFLVNKNAPQKLKHWLFDKFFSHSIKTRHKFGIAREFPKMKEIMKWILGKILRNVVDLAVGMLKRKDRRKKHPLCSVFLKLTRVNSKTIAHYSRRLIEACLPTDPLVNRNNAPSISVLIPIARKDYSSIALTIERILENTLNPISGIVLIFADEEPPEVEFEGISIQKFPESEFIPIELQELIRNFSSGRQGWVRQQVIKYLGVGTSISEATLVCDSDTYLTQKQLWIDENGVQQLQISHEYSDEYQQHFIKTFGEMKNPIPKISFVTHHQIMQKHIIREMFGSDLRGIARWLQLANFESSSPISEYHCYGRYISQRYPENCVYSQWNNIFIEWSDVDLEGLINEYQGKCNSISIHKY